ncbi:MAG: efflux RND transporter periplasmic adaptor subunit [Anaerolineaceae bacterium]|nr:efflux RND transporter periplasmic adaptor subunit [Anaerolineaceae bacterium]
MMVNIPDRTSRIVRKALLVVGALIIAAGGYAVRWALAPGGGASDAEANRPSEHGQVSQVIQMWTCAMHPQIRMQKPGKCPLCGMILVPVKVDGSSGNMRQFATSHEGQALMRIQVSPVERKFVTAEIRMVGKVEYDETRLAYIASWVPGRIDKLYVDYTGIEVKKGDHMVYLYSPELLSAQEELLQALEAVAATRNSKLDSMRETAQSTVEAAREKLRLWGLAREQIKDIEKRGKTTDHMTIYAPVGGIVIHKNAQEGMYVKTGQRIYTIADLSQVWVKLDAYESDLVWLRYGQKVAFTTEAYPGDEFVGTISFIDPVLDAKTRVVKVRVDVPNADGRLKPEMFVRAAVRANIAMGGRVMSPDLAGKWICPMHPSIVRDKAGECDICKMPLVRTESLGYVSADVAKQVKPVVIPAAAALVTGTRAVVYLQRNPFLLQKEDITDWPGLIADLRRQLQAKGPMPGKRLWKLLSPELRKKLSEFGPLDTISGPLADRLFEELSNVLARRDFYVESQWQGVELDDEISRLLAKGLDKLLPGEVLQLNRRLLERTCVDKIAKAIDKPTFVGREILLGPRAGDYYIVRHGLKEGELVVTNGAFKIDSALQIQAKPSMMTPEGGGGGGGGHHGGGGAKKKSASAKRPAAPLSAEFKAQLKTLDKSYRSVAKTMKSRNVKQIKAAFGSFGAGLKAVNGLLATGHRRMQWNELKMLLENDAVEGQQYIEDMRGASRVFESLTGNMKRVRKTFMMMMPDQTRPAESERTDVPAAFRTQLNPLWDAYRAIRSALTADRAEEAGRAADLAVRALAAVEIKLLDGQAHTAWMKESDGLRSSLAEMAQAQDLEALRRGFIVVSDKMTAIVKTFGLGRPGPVYRLKCPMAFDNRGAFWLQAARKVQNPYLGGDMPGCGEVAETINLKPTPVIGGRKHKGGREND